MKVTNKKIKTKKKQMWFYLYLLTTAFHEQMGFHMWGYTTSTNFSYDIIDRYSSYYNNNSTDKVYYSAIYQIPNKFVAFPFDRVLAKDTSFVRDDFGLEWYRISPKTVEYVCSNASIPFNILNLSVKEERDEL